jgi:hypothetical protein
MKLSAVMGLTCLGLSLVLLAMFVLEERPSVESTDETGSTTTVYLGHGQAHPEHESMLVGGSGAERGGHIWGLALAYGTLQLAFFTCCMWLGVRRNGVVGRAGWFIGAGAVIYFVAFVGLTLSYRGYMAADTLSTFGSLPKPTAWMLYGVAPIPFLFLLVFVLGFRQYVWDEESERTLARIVAEKRAAEEGQPAGR